MIRIRQFCPVFGLIVICQVLFGWEQGRVVGQQPVRLTRQIPTSDSPQRFHRLESTESWNPEHVAIVICDVWDSHHCVQAVRRVLEVAPRIDQVARALRLKGATVIHAPSDCMKSYENHPARLRARQTPNAKNLPSDIATWCDQIPSEKSVPYPIDQSDGGEDDNFAEHESWSHQLSTLHRNPQGPMDATVPPDHHRFRNGFHH